MDSEDAVERDFREHRLSYIDAIQRLENLGIDSKVAERRVCQWDDEHVTE